MSEKLAWFAASLLFERTFDSGPEAPPLYEESVVLVRAREDDEADARKKATMLGKAASHAYRNVEGESVAWTFKEILRVVQLIDADIEEGSEVYSRFLTAQDLEGLRSSFATPIA
jgi:hypothetical protein